MLKQSQKLFIDNILNKVQKAGYKLIIKKYPDLDSKDADQDRYFILKDGHAFLLSIHWNGIYLEHFDFKILNGVNYIQLSASTESFGTIGELDKLFNERIKNPNRTFFTKKGYQRLMFPDMEEFGLYG